MALDKAGLKSAIIASWTNTDNTIDEAADALASAIDAFVKTGTVNTPSGVAVQVVVGTGTGATTAAGIGTIS